jgi:hypothetical protein
MDEELAELTEGIAAASSGRPVLPVSEMTPEVQLLTTLVQLTQNMLQQRSPKKINFPPVPLPKTARQILADRRRSESRERTSRRFAEAQALWTRLHENDPATP